MIKSGVISNNAMRKMWEYASIELAYCLVQFAPNHTFNDGR